jgi:hypothetical protein
MLEIYFTPLVEWFQAWLIIFINVHLFSPSAIPMLGIRQNFLPLLGSRRSLYMVF